MADKPKSKLNPAVLATTRAVFVLGVAAYLVANPGGPGGESGERRTEDTSGR